MIFPKILKGVISYLEAPLEKEFRIKSKRPDSGRHFELDKGFLSKSFDSSNSKLLSKMWSKFFSNFFIEFRLVCVCVCVCACVCVYVCIMYW